MEIKFELSEKGLDDLLKKLNRVEEELDRAARESIKEVADETQVLIIQKLGEPRPPFSVFREPHSWSAIDTGELAMSTTVKTDGNHTEIYQESDHAFNVEFGDGEYFYMQPYPDSSKIPAGVPEHQGSYYYWGAIPGSSRWSVDKQNFSHGQYGVAHMYYGGQYIRENLAKRVQEKGRNALSKI